MRLTLVPAICVLIAAAAEAQTKAYVTNSAIDSVAVIDSATREVRGTIPVGTGPTRVVMSRDGGPCVRRHTGVLEKYGLGGSVLSRPHRYRDRHRDPVGSVADRFRGRWRRLDVSEHRHLHRRDAGPKRCLRFSSKDWYGCRCGREHQHPSPSSFPSATRVRWPSWTRPPISALRR
jgi:YVTN family beta-propeller protein